MSTCSASLTKYTQGNTIGVDQLRSGSSVVVARDRAVKSMAPKVMPVGLPPPRWRSHSARTACHRTATSGRCSSPYSRATSNSSPTFRVLGSACSSLTVNPAPQALFPPRRGGPSLAVTARHGQERPKKNDEARQTRNAKLGGRLSATKKSLSTRTGFVRTAPNAGQPSLRNGRPSPE